MSKLIVIILCLWVCGTCSAQTKVMSPHLSEQMNLQPVNRKITLSTNKTGKPVVHVNAAEGAGVVWIKDLNFTTGTIEFDVKGKDVVQESFVGIAFHGVNDTTYECVYFRPFNFLVTDKVRRKHAVQYIALPKFDWEYLRETYPDKYEHSLLTPVAPNDWFHVKVVINKNKIQAFVNENSQACLSVEPLTLSASGTVGFWVGNGSDGDFANLVLESDK